MNIEKRIKELDDEFNQVEKHRVGLIEEVKKINELVKQDQTRLIQIQGAYAELNKLIEKAPEQKVVEEESKTPKKDK